MLINFLATLDYVRSVWAGNVCVCVFSGVSEKGGHVLVS